MARRFVWDEAGEMHEVPVEYTAMKKTEEKTHRKVISVNMLFTVMAGIAL